MVCGGGGSPRSSAATTSDVEPPPGAIAAGGPGVLAGPAVHLIAGGAGVEARPSGSEYPQVALLTTASAPQDPHVAPPSYHVGPTCVIECYHYVRRTLSHRSIRAHGR